MTDNNKLIERMQKVYDRLVHQQYSCKEQNVMMPTNDKETLGCIMLALEALQPSSEKPDFISLPIITDKIIEDFFYFEQGLPLIEQEGDKFSWSQEAVDFACLIAGANTASEVVVSKTESTTEKVEYVKVSDLCEYVNKGYGANVSAVLSNLIKEKAVKL